MEYTKVQPYGCHISLCSAPPPLGSNVRILPRSRAHKRQKEGIITSICEFVTVLLEKYAKVDVIAEADADMMLFMQPSNKSGTKYTKGLWNKAFQCNRVNDKYVLKRISIEGLLESIRHRMSSCCSPRKNATSPDLVQHATSITKL